MRVARFAAGERNDAIEDRKHRCGRSNVVTVVIVAIVVVVVVFAVVVVHAAACGRRRHASVDRVLAVVVTCVVGATLSPRAYG